LADSVLARLEVQWGTLLAGIVSSVNLNLSLRDEFAAQAFAESYLGATAVLAVKKHGIAK
jgi:hypothetical protein